MIARAAATAAYPALRLFIAGRWIDREGRTVVKVIDPFSAAPLGELPCADDHDLDAALASAEQAFAGWRTMPPIERGRIIRKAAEWLRTQRETWALLISLEMGKPLAQARLEADTACELLEWAAEEGRRLYDRSIPARAPGFRQSTITGPIGPVAAIGGWNAPAITPARKISGALAAGCTIVLKPSEATPATALLIAEAFEQAGLPPGVLNIVFGDPPTIGRRFATDPTIRLLTFTGGTAVGKELGALCAGSVKRTILELGGHAPALIFGDADVDQLAPAAAMAKFRNAGQVCTSPTRFIVHESIFESFVERFVATAVSLRLGDPLRDETQMGPLQNQRRVEAVREMIADAEALGSKSWSGEAPEGPGFWQAPTVVAEVLDQARIKHEEPFGPVAVISRFQHADEAIAEANRLPFGLAAYAFTHDLRVAERLAREVEAGSLAINHWAASQPETPFGGVKESGIGLEGGAEGVTAFCQTRFVSVLA